MFQFYLVALIIIGVGLGWGLTGYVIKRYPHGDSHDQH